MKNRKFILILGPSGIGKGTTFIIELPIYQTTRRRRSKRLLKITRKTKQQMEATDEIEAI